MVKEEEKEEKTDLEETESNAAETEENQIEDSGEELESGDVNQNSEAAAEEDSSDEKVSEEEKEKARVFFKKGKKKPRDNTKEKIEELNDRIKRQMAEFENFRKRTEKEKSSMYDMGASTMAEKILPAVDSFERGLAGVDENSSDPFEDGMRMVYKQLMKALEDAGVEAIEAVGKEFDPDLHNAVMHVDDEEYGENIIVEELQKGYKYHDHVIRHSMVKVAN